MTKQEFINELESKLSRLPQKEASERISFYCEMIDDRIEEGLSEEDAVADIGTTDEIASQIVSEIPLSKLVTNKVKPKRALSAWEIVLIAVGSPIWITLLAVAFAVIITLYAVLWVLVVCAWAVFASLAACSPAGIALCVIFIVSGNLTTGLAMLGAGLVCGGLGIFAFIGSKAATEGVVLLTKTVILGIKHCFVKKEEA